MKRRQILAESDAHNAAGRYAAALSLIAEGLAHSPHEPELLFARASILFHWDRFREALTPYLRAESLGLEHDMLFLQLGWTHFYLGNLGEAEAWMRRAITRRSEDSMAHYALGVVLRGQKRIIDAVESYEQALRLSPDNINCLINLGVCKIDQGDPTAAERLLRRAIDLNPNRAMAWDNLGVALHRQDRFSEAFAVFDRAEQLEIETGENVDSFVNFANALRDNGQIQDAIDRFEENLAHRPNVYGHGQYALALLTAGRLTEGWRQSEFRWIQEPLLSQRPSFAAPVWAGQDLRGKTILLRSEQGFGDTIQFIRYAPLVKTLGATVLMQVRPGLEKMTASVAGIDRFVRPGDPIPDFDFHIHLLSLPALIGTDIDSIPADVPYLSVEPERASYWANRLPRGSELKVGLAWAGNPAHLQDRQRSIPLHVLAPLGTLEGVRFYSLQKSLPEERIDLRAPGLELEDLGPELHDFSDTAAAIGQLDLVICVDTAVGHLAGALGKPVWLLLPHSGDWRWLQGREDSPWYPTMRLFRQSRRGVWEEVVDRVRAALLAALGGDMLVHDPSKRMVTVPARPSPLQGANAAVRGSRGDLSAVAETRYGIMQYMSDDGVVNRSVAACGEYRQGELDLLGKLMRPGTTLMEVSAGIGIHSIFLARVLGAAGHLFLYEARQPTRKMLAHNLVANRVTNATLMQRELCGERVRAGVEADTRFEEGGAVDLQETETLDGLQLESLSWLKVNDGAAALRVLDGAAESLWRLRPNLFIAVTNASELDELAARSKDFGYSCWRVETPMFSARCFSRDPDESRVDETALALLAMPEEVDPDLAIEGCIKM